jgi:hypothetical protein
MGHNNRPPLSADFCSQRNMNLRPASEPRYYVGVDDERGTPFLIRVWDDDVQSIGLYRLRRYIASDETAPDEQRKEPATKARLAPVSIPSGEVVSTPPRIAKMPKITPEMIAEIKRMHKNGDSVEKIAKTFYLSYEVATRYALDDEQNKDHDYLPR